MKIARLILGSLLLVIVVVFVLQYVASERIEVVELHTEDAAGQEVTTRLWIVDDAGFQYLRSGGIESGWAARIVGAPDFELTRNGNRATYRAVPREDKRDRINQLMRAKYTWGDRVISVLVGDRDAALPLELHPL